MSASGVFVTRLENLGRNDSEGVDKKIEQCDESLRNPSLVSEDRIGGLPEPLVLQVLSSLPTKDVVATNVLSKRWRSFWKVVPNLEFESYGNIRKFVENVP
ncbi:hypothetical protein AALP_AA6G282500 [Arabis alpina]|uniref:F-box domain-containing protein n=1 Tax=Arabis alpina TaxID=50452 RepID=A0A087GS85_ARAAL|nr:hypothetical protein AALP_AA6G282500 [Arabis alpina]